MSNVLLCNKSNGMGDMKKSVASRIVSVILSLIALIVFAFAVFFVVIKIKYDVNLVSTVSGIKKLNAPVDEDTLCPNQCTEDDLVEAHYTMEYGGGSCVWLDNNHNFDRVVYPRISFRDDLEYTDDFHVKITDKQLGGVIDRLWTKEDGLDIKVGDKSLDVSLMSFKVLRRCFYEWTEFQAVLKVDFGPVKEALNGFPAKTLKKYIPDVVYITAEARITPTDGSDIYAYDIDPISLKLNNLSETKSKEIINALDSFIGFGNADELSTNIWTSIMRVIAGVRKDGEEIAGIGASLNASCWATGFESIGSVNGNDEKFYIMFFRNPQF